MIQLLANYVKDIAMLIIFIAFVGIILPSERYKKYIAVILGLVLVLAVFEPIANGLKSPHVVRELVVTQLVGGRDTTGQNVAEQFDKQRQEMIIHNYKIGLRSQLESVIVEEGFALVDFELVVDESLQLEGMTLTVFEQSKPAEKPFIRIEPVRIQSARTATENIETTQILELKNTISRFYNLSGDNIHIRVQTKN